MAIRGKTSEGGRNWGAYDRKATAGILGELAESFTDFEPKLGNHQLQIEYTSQTIVLAADGLTDSQRSFRDNYMPGFTAPLTSAENTMFWRDSTGLVNTSFYNHSNSGGFGPIVPIAAREASIALHAGLESQSFRSAIESLTDHDNTVLEGSTTDISPEQIFRVALEAAQRQVALYAISKCDPGWETNDPTFFIDIIRRSDLLRAAAKQYPWELQSSATWRAMAPGSLERQSDGLVRFDEVTALSLSSLKRHNIKSAIEKMRAAVEIEGLTETEAVEKYHRERDEAPETYMRLWQPGRDTTDKLTVCPATMNPGVRADKTALAEIAPLFLNLTQELIGRIEIQEKIGMNDTVINEVLDDGRTATTLHVPGISCQHCKHNIQDLILPSIGLDDIEVDVDNKTVRFTHDNHEAVRRAVGALEENNYKVAL